MAIGRLMMGMQFVPRSQDGERVRVHPLDAKELGVTVNDRVLLEHGRVSGKGTVELSDGIKRGVIGVGRNLEGFSDLATVHVRALRDHPGKEHVLGVFRKGAWDREDVRGLFSELAAHGLPEAEMGIAWGLIAERGFQIDEVVAWIEGFRKYVPAMRPYESVIGYGGSTGSFSAEREVLTSLLLELGGVTHVHFLIPRSHEVVSVEGLLGGLFDVHESDRLLGRVLNDKRSVSVSEHVLGYPKEVHNFLHFGEAHHLRSAGLDVVRMVSGYSRFGVRTGILEYVEAERNGAEPLVGRPTSQKALERVSRVSMQGMEIVSGHWMPRAWGVHLGIHELFRDVGGMGSEGVMRGALSQANVVLTRLKRKALGSEVFSNGRLDEILRRRIEVQGGDKACHQSDFHLGAVYDEIRSPERIGSLEWNYGEVERSAQLSGAVHHPESGVMLLRQNGEGVRKNIPIARVYGRTRQDVDHSLTVLEGAFRDGVR